MMEGVLYAFIGFAAGGILKGATGAGAPVVAVPILAMLYDVPMAVALFTVPSLVTNIWQGWSFRRAQLPRRFVARFAIAGALGALIGTFILASLSPDLLLLMVAGVVFVYIGFRLLHPDWSLRYELGERLAAPAGLVAGVLQGASGISAPVSITFLNAMRLERLQFMATISVFFFAMSLVQLPAQFHLGIMTPQRFVLSVAALVPMVSFMFVGAWLARHLSRAVFDKVILALLAAIALKLVWEGLA